MDATGRDVGQRDVAVVDAHEPASADVTGRAEVEVHRHCGAGSDCDEPKVDVDTIVREDQVTTERNVPRRAFASRP